MNKYHNRKTVVDGHAFDSALEAKRYRQLRLLERSGDIKDLVLQPRFELVPGFRNADGKKIRKMEYVADFAYSTLIDGEEKRVVEDVKGVKTEAYKIKSKLFMHRYPYLVFREVTKENV